MARPERTESDQKAIDEWLSKNKVTVCAPNARTDASEIRSQWGRKKKAGRPKKESNV
jgi:hypothetical protein